VRRKEAKFQGSTGLVGFENANVVWEPVSLSELATSTIDHRKIPVPVDRRLRIGAFAGLALTAAFTTVVGGGSGLGHQNQAGVLLFGWPELRWLLWGQPHASVLFWLGVTLASIAVLFAAATRGFARVPPLLLWGIFALVILGCASFVPLLAVAAILLANLAIWLALGILCVALGVVVLFLCVAAIGSGT
jgi:hypothetical protein